jgi:hypothetical protein
VLVWAGWQRPVYGDLGDDVGEVAALDFSCTNGGGTADGELLNGFVIFSGEGGNLTSVGVVTPQATLPRTDPAATIELKLAPGAITAFEYWPEQPPRWATTIWTFAARRLRPGRAVISTSPPRGWKP